VIRLSALSLLLVAGCAEPAKLTCTSTPKAKPHDDNEQATSIVGVIYARKLKNEALDANFGSGFAAYTMSQFAGTKAYSVSRTANQVRQMMAKAKATDFWLESDGKIALPKNSTKTCEMLANSISNLDVGQSDNQFLESIEDAETYFANRFTRFGGTDMEQQIAQLNLIGGVR
jgi:hypothetical protein